MSTQPLERSKTSNRLTRFIPILSWLPSYNRAWLVTDIIAGLTLWGLVVPEGMAYAGIANLPPQAGLYTLVASLFVYALFGSSRHLSVGATSATAALIASTVVALGVTTADMPTYVAYCRRPGPGHRYYFPGSRIGALGLGHTVFVEAGNGRFRCRIGDLCRRWTAQQTVWRRKRGGECL